MKRFLLYALFFFCAFSLSAQDGKRLQSVKIGYLTRQMNLTPEEAQRFWPVYNKYSDDLIVATIDARKSNKSEIELEETILNIRKRYNTEFIKVLPPGKVDIFWRAEKQFSNFVKKEIERRQRQQQKRSFENP
jgi:hypothetical protein